MARSASAPLIMRLLAIVAVLLLVLALAGCAREATLTAFSVEPGLITPNADGDQDVTRISYSLRRNADVSIYLLDAQGERHYFRQVVRRSTGGYSVNFGGVVEGRMLPDGDYRLVIEATPLDGGETGVAERALSIRQADTDYPRITSLGVYPDVFTPNRDGLTDRVTVSYELSKQVERIDIHLEGEDGQRWPVPEDKLRQPGAVGHHEHDYDGGIDLGAEPPPAGTYTVVVLAEDAAGNQARAETSLTIEQGGVPRAAIVKADEGMGVEWSSEVVPLGDVLYFTLTVTNIGSVPIRTHGAEPGTIYDNTQNFNTLGFFEDPGTFRIGINYEGNSAGDPYPYRWQLGKTSELTKRSVNGQEWYFLMPGQTVEVSGGIRMVEAPPLRNPRFWAGLIHEHVEFVPGEEYVNPTAITIGY